jgi:hypothetical protein
MEISSQAIATHADTGTKINIRIKVWK